MTQVAGMDKVSRIINTRWFALVVIVCVAFAIYSNTWHVPFVLDDVNVIKNNMQIIDLSNFSSLRTFLGGRAVVNFTFALNYHFGKLDVFGYHLVNILIHCANGFMVYLLSFVLLRRLPATQPFPTHIIALFAALVFVAHPLQTQAVTYISQRYASLAAFFYMGAILFYLKARTPSQGTHPFPSTPRSAAFSLQPLFFFVLVFLFGVLAFLSKQNAASLPLAIILVEAIFLGGSRREWARRLLWAIPAFALFIAFVLYVTGVFGGAGIGDVLEDVSRLSRATKLVNRWSYLCTQFSVLVIYLRLLVLPVGQNMDYYYPFRTSFFDGITPLAFAFLAGLAIMAIWKRRRYPLFTFAIFWFFVMLSVESSVIPISDALFEHRMYLPLFGFALLAAWLPFRFLAKRRSLIFLVCISVIVLLGAATYLRNRVWKDDLILWSDVLQKSPHNPRAALNLGNALGERGRYDEALQLYARVLPSYQDNRDIHYNMGVLREKQADIEGAISSYRRTLQIDPGYADAHYQLARIFMEKGDLKGAERHYSEALRMNPGDATAHGSLGLFLIRQGDMDGALEHFLEAVRINPKDEKALNNIGGILEAKGDIEGAARRYSDALALDPDNTGMRANLLRVLGTAGDPALAARYYREVLRSIPENADIHADFGVSLSRLGDIEGAIAQFREVIRIKPKDPKARYNLGLAFFRRGRMGEAAEQYRESLKIEPQNHKAQYNLALALYGSGDFTGAVKHFEEAMSHEPALKAQASYDIARAYAREGKIEESAQWLKSAVDAGFDNWNGLKTDKDLENIRGTSHYRKIMEGKNR